VTSANESVKSGDSHYAYKHVILSSQVA